MRGKVTGNLYAGRHLRITPACAGKRPCGSSSHRLCRDHPRACGEKEDPTVSHNLDWGSPPRMRGKAVPVAAVAVAAGIIPACAGKRDKTAIFEEWCRDHPRVCGEKFMSAIALWYAVGSPPHVRGKAEPERLRQLSGGITPACAGKRGVWYNQKLWCWDHPRVCGEKLVLRLTGVKFLGSPPHMRGKVFVDGEV